MEKSIVSFCYNNDNSFFLVLTPGSLPEWSTFYILVGLNFGFLCCVFNWYSFHVQKSYSERAEKGLNMINSPLKSKKESKPAKVEANTRATTENKIYTKDDMNQPTANFSK